MTPDRLGELWQEVLKNKLLLGRILEDTIEQFYSRWIRPGDLAIDVGANVGRHTLPMAAAVGDHGTLLAFEAAPLTVKKLQETLESLPIKRRVRLHMQRWVIESEMHNSISWQMSQHYPASSYAATCMKLGQISSV